MTSLSYKRRRARPHLFSRVLGVRRLPCGARLALSKDKQGQFFPRFSWFVKRPPVKLPISYLTALAERGVGVSALS